MDSPCECEHNNPDSLDARLFFTVVLAVAPAVTMDEASSLSVFPFGFWQPVSGVIDAFVDDLAAYKMSRGFSKGTALTQTRYPYYISHIHVYTHGVYT